MLSSKNLHRLGAAKKASMSTNTPVPESIDETNLAKQPRPCDPPPLYKAVISAQKTTIGGLQLDLIEARAKIEKLQENCAAAAAVLAKQADYDRLQVECKAGYDAGVEHGVNQVGFCIDDGMNTRFLRLCGYGRNL